MSNSKKKFAAGWKVVIACMLIQAIPYGVIANLQPQFMYYVVSDQTLGFTMASFSLIFTIGTLVSAIGSPIVGGLFKKISLKPLYIAGAILGCGGFAAFSMATAPWQYYLIAGVMQVGAAIISALGIPLLINAWFDEASKGKALSTAMAGGAIGNIFLQGSSVTLIKVVGFKQAYLIFGLVGLVVALPIILFMLRMPKDSSEVVRSKDAKEENNEESLSWGYTVAEAMKTKGFKFLAGGFFFVGIYVAALSVQYPAYLHLNHDVNTGIIGSVFAICSLAGTIVGGNLFDKLGPFKTVAIAGVIVLISNLSLIFAIDVTPLAYVFAVAKGLSIFAYTMGPALLVGKLFGNKEYAGVLGMVQLVFGIGFAAGSSIFGLVVDKMGYGVAWWSIVVAVILAYAGILSAIRVMDKLNKDNQSERVAA
ncbi:Inner membrane protein yhjX [uncultured Clostridium sp.]|nr:Inner membrane protein yhjX [uncultured Clostridium sp.]